MAGAAVATSLAQLSAHLREPFRTMVALAILAGFRVGELLALRCQDADLEDGELRVTQWVYEDKFQTLKSEKSLSESYKAL